MNETYLAKLMKSAQEGNQNSYEQLLTESTSIIQAYLKPRIPSTNDLDDITQTVLISLHKSRHTYIPGRSFKSWLYAISKHRLIDYLRVHYKTKVVHNQEPEEFYNIPDPNTPDPFDMEYEELYDALNELPKKQRDVIKHLKIKQLSIKECAKILNISESNVKVIAHRAYKSLRKILEYSLYIKLVTFFTESRIGF